MFMSETEGVGERERKRETAQEREKGRERVIESEGERVREKESAALHPLLLPLSWRAIHESRIPFA